MDLVDQLINPIDEQFIIPRDSILVLNDYCLLHVFSYLNNIRERLRLQRVCRRFSRLVKRGLKTDPVWLKPSNILYPSERQDETKQGQVQFQSNLLYDNCYNIVEFHNEILDFTYDEGYLGFVGVSAIGLSHVHRLFLKPRYSRKSYENWTMKEMDFDSAEFKWLLTRCDQTQMLAVYDFHLDSYILEVIPKSLVALHLIDVSLELDNFKTFLKSHGDQLKSFSYSRQTVIPLDSDRAIVNLISKYCCNLESLSLQLSHPSINYFGSFKSLNRLTIEGCGRSTSFYDRLIKVNPNLVDCKFVCNVKPDKETMARWRSSLPKLKTIKVVVRKQI